MVQLNGFRSIDIVWISGSVTVELYDGEGIELKEAMADGGECQRADGVARGRG